MNGTGDGFMTTFNSKKFGTMTLESKFTEDGLTTVNIRITLKLPIKNLHNCNQDSLSSL